MSSKLYLGVQPSIFFALELSATKTAGSPSLLATTSDFILRLVILSVVSIIVFTEYPSPVPRLKKSLSLIIVQKF